jgi:hypothetical protein
MRVRRVRHLYWLRPLSTSFGYISASLVATIVMPQAAGPVVSLATAGVAGRMVTRVVRLMQSRSELPEQVLRDLMLAWVEAAALPLQRLGEQAPRFLGVALRPP